MTENSVGMAETVLDLEMLLAPFAGGDGVGVDLRTDYLQNSVQLFPDFGVRPWGWTERAI